MDVSEKNFEAMIESALLGSGQAELPGGASPAREQGGEYGLIKPGGYRKRTPEEIKVSETIPHRSYLTSPPKKSSTTSKRRSNNSG